MKSHSEVIASTKFAAVSCDSVGISKKQKKKNKTSQPSDYGDLTHSGQDKVEVISQTTFSNAFSWKRMTSDYNFTDVCS